MYGLSFIASYSSNLSIYQRRQPAQRVRTIIYSVLFIRFIHMPKEQKMQNITPPAHPLPPGGHMPDLNLAGSDGFNVASGQSIQSQPDPAKPAPYVPALSG